MRTSRVPPPCWMFQERSFMRRWWLIEYYSTVSDSVWKRHDDDLKRITGHRNSRDRPPSPTKLKSANSPDARYDRRALPCGPEPHTFLNSSSLPPHPPAIHRQYRAAHVVRRRRCQEHHRARQILRFAPASRRNPRQNRRIPHRVGAQRRRVVGRDIPRRDRVHLYVAPRPLVGQRLGQLRHPALRRCVSRHRNAALKAQQRCREYDLPRPALQHAAAEFARQHELRAQIDLDDLVPILIRMLGRRLAQNRAAVVDQDIHRRAFRLHLGDKRVHRRAIRQIARVGPAPAAARRHLPLYRAAFRFHAGTGGHDVRARFRQGHRHRLADAAPGAGDQSGLAAQIEFVEYSHCNQSVQLTRIFMQSPPPSMRCMASSRRPSGSTPVISFPSGSRPDAASSIARSKSSASYTRAPVSFSSRQKKRNRSTLGASPKIATTTMRPRVRGNFVIVSAPACDPETSKTTSAPAPRVRALTSPCRSVSSAFAASIPRSRASCRRNALTSASTTRAPRARATHATRMPMGPPPITAANSPSCNSLRRTS